jgi:hypothetical protein
MAKCTCSFCWKRVELVMGVPKAVAAWSNAKPQPIAGPHRGKGTKRQCLGAGMSVCIALQK